MRRSIKENNLSLFKDFGIWRDVRFQFRAETQNLFNHPNAGNPNSEIEQGFDPTNPVASNFGTVTSMSFFYTPRILQLAGKIIF